MTGQVLTEHVSAACDIIKELHSKQMFHVLQSIFKYFDKDTIDNAELTSKDWRSAISDGNSQKLWNNLIYQKTAIFPLWEQLHFLFSPSLDFSSNNNCLSSRKIFSKTQFTAETLKKNLLLFEYTRDFVKDRVDVEELSTALGVRYCFRKNSLLVMNEKYVAFKWRSQIKIWNRHSLKIEEILSIRNDIGFNQLRHPQNLRFLALWDDALLYAYDQQIILRNLVTRKTEDHEPPWMNPANYINFLLASNGYLVVGVNVIKNQMHHAFQSAIAIWKIKKPVEIEWGNFQMIPLTLDEFETFIDHKFVIFTHRTNQSELICDVRKMSDPVATENVLQFPSVKGEHVSYKDGLLIITSLKADIMIADVESGVSRTILQTDQDFASCLRLFSVSIHSDYVLLMCNYFNKYSVLMTKIQVWDFQVLKNPPSDSPIQPFCSFQESNINFMETLLTFRVDLFGLVFLTLSPITKSLNLLESSSYVIRVLNFLPYCNFCKQIKKKLLRCGQCKSAKYCNRTCQKADWRHHKELCHSIYRNAVIGDRTSQF